MANKYRNEVVGILNGHEYKLRATFNALVEIEDALDTPLPRLQATILGGQLRVKTGAVIFEKACIASGQGFDRDQLLADIEHDGVAKFGEVIVDFMSAALFGGENLKKNLQAEHRPSRLKTFLGKITSALR